ncbi:MAG: hypothetical protein IIY06_00070 [Proteobacteria bacterium]|nr:hypothetical protein [Pseudomonadota bacterium]
MFNKLFLVLSFCLFAFCLLGCPAKQDVQTASSSLTSYDRLVQAESMMYELNYVKAIDLLNGIIENEGPSAYALTLRGIAYAKTNKPNFAILDLIEATRIDYSPNTLMNVGNAERMFGHCERAADAYNKALVLAPDDIEILTNLISAYVCYGAMDLAEAAFKKVASLNQTNEIIETNRATYWATKEDWNNARAAAELAIKMNASYAPAYKTLMYVCGKQGDNACHHEAERQHKIASLPKSTSKTNYGR